MRARVTEQLHAIFLRAGERLLMAMHHSGRIFLHRSQSDETLALQNRPMIGRGKSLKIRVNAGGTLMFQDAGADPVLEEPSRTSVGVIGFRICRRSLSKND